VNYCESRQAADATAESMRSAGSAALSIRADVRRDSDVRAMVEQVASAFGRIDILVNCAGVTHYVDYDNLSGVTDEIWNEILDVNLRGTFYCARAAAGHLKVARGTIINIGSIAGYRGPGSSLPYGISKAGVIQLTRELAVALAPEVRVNSVSPGIVSTRWARLRRGQDWAEQMETHIGEVTPLHRVAVADDVADAVAALIAADFVTGQDLVVDGGKSVL